MLKTEKQYEIEAKEYVSNLTKPTQHLAKVAIDDCLALGRTWRWIATALNKKGFNNWERFKFGLLFNRQFNASVVATITREDEAENADLDDFFSVLEKRNNYVFPDKERSNKIIPDSVTQPNESKRAERDGKQKLLFYHPLRHGNNQSEKYEPHLFKYYEQILDETAIDLNIPAIKYGLERHEIPDELVSIYREALERKAGDLYE